jgi:outer membrane protein assembly factor BamA
VVNPGWIDETDDLYISRVFYKYDRKMFRFKVDLQGPFYGENMKWAAGVNLLNFKVAPVDIDRLNKGKSGDDVLDKVDGLYEKYRQWGIISEEEEDGGFIPELKAGLVYDSRDNRPNPMRGIWTEAVVAAVPGFLGAESSFAKFSITHRQYFTLIPEDLSLAYRLGWQSTIAGKVPFYYQTQIIVSEMRGNSSEGLGGAKSLRGIRRNRIMGDGVFYGNLEARWKFVRFQFLNNNFYLGLNGFTDFGRVIQRMELNSILSQLPEQYFDLNAEKMHFSYGAGLRVTMNQNFIIAVDYGLAADERDGDSGLYIGLNYLF